ncbi:hypothetical protein EVAR_52608_1 [Eumeta japonica]|uniref:Uncharacterized protein n=1 Tax=Eumeta variegata TaxID=151549 RepID=A0A4C1YQM2_EUMVA|nr:hypothetical protein EVAR_52608_1 [Eumeta japonica]
MPDNLELANLCDRYPIVPRVVGKFYVNVGTKIQFILQDNHGLASNCGLTVDYDLRPVLDFDPPDLGSRFQFRFRYRS